MNENATASDEPLKGSGAAQESDDAAADFPGDFHADLPLAILESVRQHDRPSEVLEDEDLSASLPRRLGLTGVVDNQIQRYRTARKRGERISGQDMASLLRLVLRRPDGEAILKEAGREVARLHGRKPLYRLAGAARILPSAISSRIAKRTVRRLMRRIGGGAALKVTRTPFRVRLNDPITSRDSVGLGCVLYSAAIEEAVQHATGRRPAVQHTECEARGDGSCVWTVEF